MSKTLCIHVRKEYDGIEAYLRCYLFVLKQLLGSLTFVKASFHARKRAEPCHQSIQITESIRINGR